MKVYEEIRYLLGLKVSRPKYLLITKGNIATLQWRNMALATVTKRSRHIN